MNLLRRQPEHPGVYNHPLAYSLGYDWGEMHMTNDALSAYQMAPLEHVPMRLDRATFASRLVEDRQAGPRFHLLVASPDEYLPEIKKTINNPYIGSRLGKRSIETVVSMPDDQEVEFEIAAGFIILEHYFAEAYEFEVEKPTVYIIGGPDGQEVSEQELRDYAKTLHKATTLANAAKLSITSGYPKWRSREHMDELPGAGTEFIEGIHEDILRTFLVAPYPEVSPDNVPDYPTDQLE
jgi:hypothetical protein